MRNTIKKVMVVVMSVIMLLVISMLASGCSMEVTARSSAYYKNENKGDVYKSRAVEKQNSGKWSWGSAGKD